MQRGSLDRLDVESLKARARRAIEAERSALLELSHLIHDNPELGLEERRACSWMCDFLSSQGFDVEVGPYGFPTAFEARVGDHSGSVPRFVVCAEYDALPSVGHACGHNIIAAAAAGAGVGAAAVCEDAGFGVTVLGTPAEETIGAKAAMVHRGAFDGYRGAMMVHPGPVDVLMAPFLAVTDMRVVVSGRASHASFKVGNTSNPLDVLVAIYEALSKLPLGEWERCSGVITEGGEAPNVVPERVEAYYYLRAKDVEQLVSLRKRVESTARAIAEGTGCSIELASGDMLFEEMAHDEHLARLYQKNAEALGRRFFPQNRLTPAVAASTDMGNVSKVVPSIHPAIGIDSLPYLNHEKGFAEAARDERGDRAVMDGAIAMAWTMIDAVS